MKIIKYIVGAAAGITILSMSLLNASAEADMSNTEKIEILNNGFNEKLSVADEATETTMPEFHDIYNESTSETAIVNDTEISKQSSDVNAGWRIDNENRKYYINEAGNYLKGYQNIDNKNYYFAENGVMKNGWYTVDGIRMYFSPENGERIFGWIQHNGNLFYINENGKYEGLKTIDGKDYIFDSNGILQSGWIEYQDNKYYSDNETGIYKGQCEIDGIKYLFSSKGKLKTGWQTVDEKRVFYDYKTVKPVYGWINYNGYIYYADKQSGKKTDDTIVNGLKYRFDDNGCLKLGFQTFNDGIRYYEPNGKICIGFKEINNYKYYFNNQGIMQTGWQNIGNLKYYFDKNGTMKTGWMTEDNKKYYFGNNGVMQTGWQTIKDKKYYFDSKGVMLTGWQTIDNKKYYFDKNGIVKTGWMTEENKRYHFDNTGVMQTGLQAIKDKKYYFNSKGVMQTGWHTIDGKNYFFNEDGDMREKIYKVFIGAGHGGVDSGAVKYIVEKEYTIKTAYVISEILHKHGVEFKLSRTEDIDTTMESKLLLCNNYNPDLIIDVHFNAGVGHGFEVYYSHLGGTSKTLAENINNEVSKIIYSNGIKTWVLNNGTDRFTIIREGVAPAVLCEGGFVDDINDAEFIKNNYRKLAECYAKGVLKTLGIQFKG